MVLIDVPVLKHDIKTFQVVIYFLNCNIHRYNVALLKLHKLCTLAVCLKYEIGSVERVLDKC